MRRPGPDPHPLHSPFDGEPFSVTQATADGISRRRLRSADLARSYWGLRSQLPPTDVEDRCRLLRLRMPEEAFFSHSTAALLHGIPVPLYRELDTDLHISFRRPARAPHANGIRGHRSSATELEIVELRGLRVTTPARTWSDLADLLSTFDLVAAGDYLIHHRSPLVSRSVLADVIEQRTNPRNIRRLHEAYPLMSDRSESPPESILRAITTTAGFSQPVVNHAVTDQFGEFVARTDLRFIRERLILEYQGDYHRTTKGQWRADMTRRAKLEALGWVVIELNADDLRDPRELVARIRSRLANAR